MTPSPDRLFTLKVQSYRSFRDETALDIRPLTLLYGFNQAGKSTLLRLLGLIGDSLHPGAGPLALHSPAVRGASFKELGHLGRGTNLSPWLTVVAPSPPADPTLRIQFTESNGLAVNRLRLTAGPGGDKFMVDLTAVLSRVGNNVRATYEGRYRGGEWSGPLSFDRLIPDGLPPAAQRLADAVQAALAPLERLQWLDANRLVGGSDTRPVRCCRPDGADLPTLLRAEPGPSVLAAASDWLAAQEGLGKELRLSTDGTGRQQLVHRACGEALPLFLAGEGLRALVPILLCALWAETGAPGAPTLLAVEEPEAHLHPTVQVALLDRLVQTVRAGVPVVLETHSVYLLRAMQFAVLEGRLSAGEVGLNWIDQDTDGASRVTAIGIGADATLSGWWPDVFEKEQELAHRILDLRWQPREAP